MNEVQRQRAEQLVGEMPYYYCNAAVTFEPGRSEVGLYVAVSGNQTPWDYCALGLAIASVARGIGAEAYIREFDEQGNKLDGFVVELD